jgi:hypothetical protein
LTKTKKVPPTKIQKKAIKRTIYNNLLSSGPDFSTDEAYKAKAPNEKATMMVAKLYPAISRSSPVYKFETIPQQLSFIQA